MSMIRVIQWNISFNCHAEKIAEFLRPRVSKSSTVVCLQEVSLKDFDILCRSLNPRSSAISLTYREPGPNEGRNRHLGVAVLTFDAEIVDAGVLERTVFPDRTLRARISTNQGEVKVATFHSLTGVGYKNAKSSNFAAIADYLQENTDLDFLCFDANEPKVDGFNIDDLHFWSTNGDQGAKAALIMGSTKVHNLGDSFRRFHEQRSTIPEALPVTHLTRGIGRRYDYVFSSPLWQVTSIDHPLQASLGASSDHSAVIADFRRGESLLLGSLRMEPWELSYDWDGPLEDDWVAHLQLVVDDATPAVTAAFDAWLRTLEQISVRHLPGEVYGLGGATLTVARQAGGTPVSVSLRSGGQDAFDSLEYAADALSEALQGAEVHWVEMPYEPAFAPHDDEASGEASRVATSARLEGDDCR